MEPSMLKHSTGEQLRSRKSPTPTSIQLQRAIHQDRQARSHRQSRYGRECVIIPPPVTAPELIRPKILPDSVACRLYVLTVLVETAIDLAVESELLLHMHRATEQIESSTGQNLGSADTKKMSVYLSIFVLAQCVAINPIWLPLIGFSAFSNLRWQSTP